MVHRDVVVPPRHLANPICGEIHKKYEAEARGRAFRSEEGGAKEGALVRPVGGAADSDGFSYEQSGRSGECRFSAPRQLLCRIERLNM